MDGFGNVFGAFELCYSLPELADLVGDGCQRFGQGISNLLGIGNNDTLALAEDDVTGNAHDGGFGGNVAKDDRTRANAAVLADDDIAENLCPAADNDVILERWVALAVFF